MIKDVTDKGTAVNILIVDDEQSILDILSTGLSHRGYKCFVAKNATEGLRIAERENIHFSLLDIRLPDRSGIELCADIYRISPNTKNALMTGYPGIRSAVEGMKHHAYDYLVKPFRIEQVTAIIEKAMREMKHIVERSYNEEIIRNLRDENEELKRYIGEMLPNEFNHRIQSLSKYKVSQVDQETAARSYTRQKQITDSAKK